MFNIFKKLTKTNIPKEYKDLIDEKGFNLFLEKCFKTLTDLGYKNLKNEDKSIFYINESGKEVQCPLDNLLRKYLQVETSQRDLEILSHFTALNDNGKAYDYMYKDYEYAKQFLKVLIKADDVLPDNDSFVFQKEFPNLLTLLVFDFNDQFHFVQRKRIAQWGIDDIDLFNVAKNNLKSEKFDVKKYLFDDQYCVYALLESDFCASYTLLIDQELEFATGKYGTLIALPTKELALVYPINNDDILDVIVSIYPAVEERFNQDPGNITLDFYWYFNGKYEVFEKEANEDGSIDIIVPEKLLKMFN